MEMERILVVGAGAMGCFFAARLAEVGVDVALIDVDDSRLAALARDGVTVDDDRGRRTIPVPASRSVAVSLPADLIVVFTKGTHTAAAAASVAHLVRPDTLALTLQNGIGNAEAIAATIDPARILVGVTDIPCDLKGPAEVASHGAGRIQLGGQRGGASPEAAEAVASLLQRAGLVAVADPSIGAAIWEKVAFNAAMNALCTVTGLTVGGLDVDPGHRLIASVISEVAAVAAAGRTPVDTGRILGKIDNALATHRSHKPSMLQDRLAGRPTEIETINGAVVQAAKHVGLDAPVNRTLADLVRLIETAANQEASA